jgi:hypothetical protein
VEKVGEDSRTDKNGWGRRDKKLKRAGVEKRREEGQFSW